jgi:hypothetical protein
MSVQGQEGVFPWPQVDPDFVLGALRGLSGCALPNGKPFFKSYREWNSLTHEQKNKATAYYNSLAPDVKSSLTILVNNLANDEAQTARQSQQAAATSANDRARMMHAMVDPINQPALKDANIPLKRERLNSVDERRAPWDRFADNFNDYELCVYQNATIEYVKGLPVNPYQARLDFETMAVFTHGINPTDETRPLRDGAWCERIWKEIRSATSCINQSYRNSGNQDAENIYTEWIKYCENYSEVYKYVKAVFSDGYMDNMGLALPRAQQRDTGALRDPRDRVLSNTPGAVNQRRKRQRRTEMHAGSSDGSGGTRSAVTHEISSILQVLDKQLNLTRQMRTLEMFATYVGNDPIALERKVKAIARLHIEAFGYDEDYEEE